MKDLMKDIIICPFCGVPAKIIWVHGHGQCAYCGNVVDECCRGETNDNVVKEDKKTEKDNSENDENSNPGA